MDLTRRVFGARRLINQWKQPGAVSLVISVMILNGVGRSYARDSFQATRVAEPPVLDGRLTEAGWQAAGSITGFKHGGETRALYQSVGYVLYDDNYLYIGVRCLEPHPENIKTTARRHDGSIFDDDGVEIMVNPDSSRSRYFQFVVNASGATFDAVRTHSGGNVDPGWDGDISAAASIAEDYWSVELRIPFYALELSPQVGPNWEFNICRKKQTPSEMSAIADDGKFYEPWKFAVLNGVDSDLAIYRIEAGRPLLVGEMEGSRFSASASISVTRGHRFESCRAQTTLNQQVTEIVLSRRTAEKAHFLMIL